MAVVDDLDGHGEYWNYTKGNLRILRITQDGFNVMPSSHFYVQSYGLLRFGHTWGVVVNRGRNRRVYLVMRN